MSLLVCGACAMSAQAAAENTSAKVDVLGRHISDMRKMPDAYVKNVAKQANRDAELNKESPKKPKSLARSSSYPYPGENHVQPVSGEYSYRAFSGSKKYILNGETMNESTYLSRINDIEHNDAVREGYIRGGHTFYYPVEGNHNYIYSYNVPSNPCINQNVCDLGTVYMNGYYGGTENITVSPFSYVAQNVSHVDALYGTGAQGNGIGIYFLEKAAPTKGIVPSNKLIYGADCNPASYNGHSVVSATNMARGLNTVAPGATIHSYSDNCSEDYGEDNQLAIPVDGFYTEPQMHVGNVSFTAMATGTQNNYYGVRASVLDDIVYNTRQIQFAGAGDYAAPLGQMNELALSLNAITVGAVRNGGTYYKSSSWKNGVHPQSGMTYAKPEIANVADFYFSDPTNPSIKGLIGVDNPQLSYAFLGTASASTYTTATVALLLEKYPFYRWHPEVVKALLLTSSTKPISNASHDQDNAGSAVNYLDASQLIGKNHSRFWYGNNGDYFVNVGSYDKMEFDEINLKPNHKYRVAISWLVSGDYVYHSGALPFDLDIEVLQNGRTLGSSSSYDNPFEVVEFTTDNSNSNVTMRVRRYFNNGGRVVLGYNLLEL